MRGFWLATRVRLGAEALEALNEFRGRPVFLVTDDFLVTTGVYRRVVDRLGERVTTFTGVKPNPSTSEIGARVSVYPQSRPDAVAAYGGGSVMDTTKVMHKVAFDVSLGAPEGIVAIPTTSGPGSEVTSLAAATDEQTHTKVPIASSELVAGLAILDPEVVIGAPPHITADPGMDVLTHATEAYVALEARDLSDALARKAVGLVSENLEHCHTHGDDLEVCSRTHNTSCMAVMAFDDAGPGIVHSLVYALDGHYPIAHGRLNALLLPHVTESNAVRSDHAAERYARPSRLLHLSARGRATVMSLIGAVKWLRSRLGIPSWLSDLKVASEVLRRDEDGLVATALADGCTTITPVAPSPDDLKGILRRTVREIGVPRCESGARQRRRVRTVPPGSRID